MRTSDTSQRGITTAAHCSNSQKFNGRSVLTFISQHAGSQGDAQWHRSSEYVSTRFYYKPGATRNVERVATPALGQRICRYGKTTGAHCDDVYKKNQCRDVYCGLMATHRRHAEGGDSGGPWYYGPTAYGIHHGWKTIFLIRRDLFTPVRQAHSVLGVLCRCA
jgi:streptogrisin C